MSPGNPPGHWTTYAAYAFPEPARLQEGQLYHIVFTNTDAAPDRDYISVNELFSWEEQVPVSRHSVTTMPSSSTGVMARMRALATPQRWTSRTQTGRMTGRRTSRHVP